MHARSKGVASCDMLHVDCLRGLRQFKVQTSLALITSSVPIIRLLKYSNIIAKLV